VTLQQIISILFSVLFIACMIAIVLLLYHLGKAQEKRALLLEKTIIDNSVKNAETARKLADVLEKHGHDG